MTCRRAAFAVPGDLMSLTGGYLYDRRLLAALRARGREVTHIALAGSFPEPSPADNLDAAQRLGAVHPQTPVIIDGLALGAMDHAVLRAVSAPIVALVHHPLAEESGLEAGRRDALYRSERANLALAARVIVTSPHTAALLRVRYAVPAARITVARPGADRPLVRPGADRPAEAVAVARAKPPLLLSVGIAVPRKGHDVLLRALDQVADRPWQAVIVGSARDAAHAALLAQLASDPRLSGRVRLAGRVPAPVLAQLYSRASLFALATRYEGHGIVFDEAMVHGLPIVSCATGAVPDTVAPGAGLLVPRDDPDAFAAALAKLLDDGELRARMAAASAAGGATLPRWSATAQCVDEVLDRVASSG